MCESKGLAPNVLKGGALGQGLLCLSWKRIMSGTQCQGYHIYKALWVLWMVFKLLCKIITYVLSLTSRRGQKPSSSGCVTGKGSWDAHSSHYSFPAPPNTTHIATVNYRGAGEVCKLTQEESGESPEGGLGRGKREGRAAWLGRPATMPLNNHDS